MIDPTYTYSPGYEAALASVGTREHRDFSRARSVGWVALWSLAMGAAWAVLAPHLRRRGLAVLCAALVLVAGARWALALAAAAPARVWGQYYWSSDLVFERYGGPLMPIGLATGAAFLFAGMLIGRPIARGLIRLLLPPRLRAPFGALWTLQGLEVPGGRARDSRIGNCDQAGEPGRAGLGPGS
jgi:hypothetical protein